jgi:hypothetical protein
MRESSGESLEALLLMSIRPITKLWVKRWELQEEE